MECTFPSVIIFVRYRNDSAKSSTDFRSRPGAVAPHRMNSAAQPSQASCCVLCGQPVPQDTKHSIRPRPGQTGAAPSSSAAASDR